MAFEKKKPEIAVVAIISQRGKVLLTRRSKDPKAGFWHLPGGALEFGETFDEALRRELKEELGIEARLSSRLPVAIACSIYPAADPRKERHIVALYFRAEIASGEPRALDATDAIAWMSEAMTKKAAANGVLLDSCARALRQDLGWAL
jgi:8-oxo-dGTP diphosphatase